METNGGLQELRQPPRDRTATEGRRDRTHARTFAGNSLHFANRRANGNSTAIHADSDPAIWIMTKDGAEPAYTDWSLNSGRPISFGAAGSRGAALLDPN
jgi:hypothetical protein